MQVIQVIQVRRPPPPGELSEAEREVWKETVATMPADWFRRAQFPLLIAYCRHVVRSALLAKMIADFKPEWIGEEGGLARLDKLLAMAERETRALNACARSMRITHQAQILPRGAGRAADRTRQGKAPWE
jgi:hypothetical protein